MPTPTANRLRARGAREEKQEKDRNDRSDRENRKNRDSCYFCHFVPFVPPVPLVSPLFTGIFFNTRAHKGAPKTLRSLRFFKKPPLAYLRFSKKSSAISAFLILVSLTTPVIPPISFIALILPIYPIPIII